VLMLAGQETQTSLDTGHMFSGVAAASMECHAGGMDGRSLYSLCMPSRLPSVYTGQVYSRGDRIRQLSQPELGRCYIVGTFRPRHIWTLDTGHWTLDTCLAARAASCSMSMALVMAREKL
jgi:hypothetical protein